MKTQDSLATTTCPNTVAKAQLYTAAIFSPSPPPKEERGGVRRPIIQAQIPSPQPSPRSGGERESAAVPSFASVAGQLKTACAARLLLLLLLTLPAVVQAQFNYTTNDGTITITGYTGSGGAVTIPSTINGLPVTRIGDSAFAYRSLTSVTITNSVTSIGNNAFYDCGALTNVTFGSSVTSIGTSAFRYCDSLTGIMIPDSVTRIGDGAFYDTGITNVIISASVTNIGSYAFGYCFSLPAITVDALNPVYSSVDGVLFNKSTNTLIQCGGGRVGSYTVPNSVTNIGDGAFYQCAKLTGITIPEGFTSIPGAEFAYCSSLTSITVPNSVTNIGWAAFYACTSLTNVIIGTNTTSIEGDAFDDCSSLTSVTIPNSVTNIGSQAFFDCISLTNVIIPDGVINIGSEAFAYCFSLTAITVDALNPVYSSVDGVLFNKNQTRLIKYPGGKAGSYTVPNSVTSIETNAFMLCATITNITFGNSVTNIGIEAFYSCANLSSVTIPNSVVSIGGAAFENCSSLTNVMIGNSATRIDNSAFFNCSSLTAITVDALNPAYSSAAGVLFNQNQTTLIQYPGGKTGSYTISNNVTCIGSYAFDRCHLASVMISDSVTNIGNYAFEYCNSLTNITIGNGVNSIGSGTFEGCHYLTSVTIPNSVTSIGDNAFSFCGLTNVTIGNGVTHIGVDAFEFCSNLKMAFFKGNKPISDSSVFTGDFNATVYYLPGTTGWGATFGGRPTVLWNPQVLTSDASFGVRTNQFGFNIIGTTNIPIVVEACTSLGGDAWVPLQSVSLTNGSFLFNDPQWTNYPGRFYRLRSP